MDDHHFGYVTKFIKKRKEKKRNKKEIKIYIYRPTRDSQNIQKYGLVCNHGSQKNCIY
jgi:hypothetical protein